MPMILWTRLLMETQGYEVKYNIVYQDSKSTMLLVKNGKYSSVKMTKHINVRYFLWQISWRGRTPVWNISPHQIFMVIFIPRPHKAEYKRLNSRQSQTFNIMIPLTTYQRYTSHQYHRSVLGTITPNRMKFQPCKRAKWNAYVYLGMR